MTAGVGYHTLFPQTLFPKNTRAIISAMFVKYNIFDPPFRFLLPVSNLRLLVRAHAVPEFPIIPDNYFKLLTYYKITN